MRILFELRAVLEVPDANYIPHAEDVQREFQEHFESEDLIILSMEIMNYIQEDGWK